MNQFLDSLIQPPRGTSHCASPENVYARPGAAAMDVPGAPAGPDVAAIGQIADLQEPHPSRELGRGYKVRPWIYLAPNAETAIFDADGPGMIRHFWITLNEKYLRRIVLRMYWDGESSPSVETPIGDFFCNAPGYYGEMQSAAICVNPHNAMNSYWPMPFRKHARITLESQENETIAGIYYAINFTREPIPDDALYLHASFRRTNPLPYGEDFVIADGIRGAGRFAGCYLAWQQNNSTWWGEGEVKMFLDGDREFPSICSTGTEDYFCGAWNFGTRTFHSLYAGCICIGPEKAGSRHALYRFHIADPIWFQQEFKMTIQALGWRTEGRFLPLQDDLSAVAIWYQSDPHAPLPPLPDRNGLEII